MSVTGWGIVWIVCAFKCDRLCYVSLNLFGFDCSSIVLRYVRIFNDELMIEPKSVNIIVNAFAAPVNVEELFADTSDDGLNSEANIITDALTAGDIFERHFCSCCFLYFWIVFVSFA